MQTKRFFPLLSAIVISLLLLATLASANQVASMDAPVAQDSGSEQPAERPTGQIIIKFKAPAGPGTGETDRAGGAGRIGPEELAGPDAAVAQDTARLSQAAGVQLTYLRQMSGGAHVYRLPQAAAAAALTGLTAGLEALPEVEYAEPDQIMTIQATPNDPYYNTMWNYFTPSPGNYGVNLPPAWDITKGSASTVVAVIDTGLLPHPDLAGRILPGYDFIADLPTANDGDGRDADASDPGDWVVKDECGPGSKPNNSSWHGTHVAGTIAANTNNGLGVAGVNWNAKILPVRVLGKCGGYISDITDGMRWSAGLSVPGVPANPTPAHVLNLSLGGYGACGSTYQNAINSITAKGKTIVVAAGNSGDQVSNYRPANCSGVITVAATNRNGSRALYSNYGAAVEISAPGGEGAGLNDPNGIRSTLNDGATIPGGYTYSTYNGTSMATPHVAGIVSLMYGLKPSLTPLEALAALQNTATAFPAGSTCSTANCGRGIANAAAALQYVKSNPPACTNLFQDPSFEQYTPNPAWGEASTNFTTPLCTATYCGTGGGTALPRTGEVWGWFGGTSAAETASLSQTVTIPYGSAKLEFYLWLGLAGVGSDASDRFAVRIDDTPVFSANATQTALYPSYTKVTVDVSSFADGGSHTVTFRSVTEGQTVNFNLDDVSLCRTAGKIYLPMTQSLP